MLFLNSWRVSSHIVRYDTNLQLFKNCTNSREAQIEPSPEAKPKTGSKREDLKSGPVQIGGFEMTSHTNKSLLN
jgi:hypothetical protein